MCNEAPGASARQAPRESDTEESKRCTTLLSSEVDCTDLHHTHNTEIRVKKPGPGSLAWSGLGCVRPRPCLFSQTALRSGCFPCVAVL